MVRQLEILLVHMPDVFDLLSKAAAQAGIHVGGVSLSDGNVKVSLMRLSTFESRTVGGKEVVFDCGELFRILTFLKHDRAHVCQPTYAISLM